MADETEAARQALQDLARRENPVVTSWLDAAGVRRRDLAQPMTPVQLTGLLHVGAMQSLARALETGTPLPGEVLADLNRAVTVLDRVRVTVPDWRRAVGASGEPGFVQWRRTVNAVRFPLKQQEIIRLEQDGQAGQVTPAMLSDARGLTGDLDPSQARLARTFVCNVASRHLHRDPGFADLMMETQIDLAERADDPGERDHWTREALTSLCSVTAQRMPDGPVPPGWGGPATATGHQGYYARRLIRICRAAVGTTRDAGQQLWYTKAAVTAAQAASGSNPALLQEAADFPVSQRESAALSLAALAGMRANADSGAEVSPPDELRSAAHAIGSSDAPVAGEEFAADRLLTTTWSRVHRDSLVLSVRGQRHYTPSQDKGPVAAAMTGLYRDPLSWQSPGEAMTALAGASRYLVAGCWPGEIAAVAIAQHVRLGDTAAAVALAERLADTQAGTSGSSPVPAQTWAVLVNAVSHGEAYASGLLERTVDALAERDAPAWTGESRMAVSDAGTRARALDALCAQALASRSSEPGRAERALRRIADMAEADTQYNNHEVKAVGALAALALGDEDRALRLARWPVGSGHDPGQSLVPGYIERAISAAGNAPAPALPDGEATAPPGPWKAAGQALTTRLAELARASRPSAPASRPAASRRTPSRPSPGPGPSAPGRG